MKGWPRQCGDGVVKLDEHSFMTSQGGNNITPRHEHPVPTSRDTPLGEGNELDVFRRVTSPTHRGQDPTEQKNDKVGVVQNYENNDGFQPINLNVKYRGLKPSVIS